MVYAEIDWQRCGVDEFGSKPSVEEVAEIDLGCWYSILMVQSVLNRHVSAILPAGHAE